MTTLTMRYMRGHFIVTTPDIEPVMFKSRHEAKDWCTRSLTGTCHSQRPAPVARKAVSRHHPRWEPGA
jgi:hypothetical protein